MRQKDILYLKQASFEFEATDSGFARLNGFGAVQNIGSSDRAMLGEGIGQFSPPTTAGNARKLPPDVG